MSANAKNVLWILWVLRFKNTHTHTQILSWLFGKKSTELYFPIIILCREKKSPWKIYNLWFHLHSYPPFQTWMQPYPPSIWTRSRLQPGRCPDLPHVARLRSDLRAVSRQRKCKVFDTLFSTVEMNLWNYSLLWDWNAFQHLCRRCPQTCFRECGIRGGLRRWCWSIYPRCVMAPRHWPGSKPAHLESNQQ